MLPSAKSATLITVGWTVALCFLGPTAALSLRAGEIPGSGTNLIRKLIVYAGDQRFPPYEYLDTKGRPAGLNVDLIRAAARQVGLEVRVEMRPWKQVPAGLQTGQFDVAAMYRSPRRAREMDFTIPHELIYHEMYVRRGAAPPNSLADLGGKRVIVERDAYADDAMDELGYTQNLMRVESEPEALHQLAAGEGDVAIVSQGVGRPFHDRKTFSDKVVAAGPPILFAEYAFATRKDRRNLIELLNQGMAGIKASGEFDRIYESWIHPDRSAPLVRRIGWVLAGTLAVVLAGGFWTYALRRRVAQQTEELRREFHEKERALDALAQTERSLRQSQKMEVVGRLAGGIAHDFNNILTVILTYATFMREDFVAQKKETAEVDEILSATERAIRLTKQLLGFSRATPSKVEAIDLVATVRSMRTMVQRLVGEHITLEVTCAGEPVMVEADLVSIEQMILNLAANARDAMAEGGRLKIAVEHRQLPGERAAAALDEYGAIIVTDEGVGMSPEMLEKIFDPFFTTKGLGQGTGLGLATVMANVTKLKGKVLVESKPAKGATFTLLLPRSRAAGAGGPAAKVAGNTPRINGHKSVLLVEDDDSLRHAARAALHQAGFKVVEARDGIEAAEVAAHSPEISFLVTDVVMPRRSGPQLAADLRGRMPGLSILFMSGYVRENEKLDLSQPRTAFLAKPYTPQELIEAVLALDREAAG